MKNTATLIQPKSRNVVISPIQKKIFFYEVTRVTTAL